jgi:ElaB/YqjD/DUF883 family membrane-anchored ribosome-binding protein
MANDPVREMHAATDRAADRGQSELEELRRQIKDLTDKYGSMAEGTLSEVKQTVRQNMGDIEQQIRDKPVQSALIAAGVGFMIGALISR